MQIRFWYHQDTNMSINRVAKLIKFIPGEINAEVWENDFMCINSSFRAALLIFKKCLQLTVKIVIT